MKTLTRDQKEELLLDYLCYDQIGEYAFGKDGQGNTTTIQWIGSREEWQIIDCYNGETNIAYESGGCEKAVACLEDEVLDSIIDDLNLELDEEDEEEDDEETA